MQKLKKIFRMFRLPRRFLYSLFALIAAVVLPWGWMLWQTRSKIFSLDDAIPPAPIAIVFGAGLTRQGLPTPYLHDRVATAVTLYQQGKVKKLLMSGDNRSMGYNEPEAMKTLAVSLGVPPQDIAADYAGLRTYDTCYRARFVFGVGRALLVSQSYHLPRAVFTCAALGIDVDAVSANRRQYFFGSWLVYQAREVAACDAAIVDLFLWKPQPILGPMETDLT
jgi:SanA protein